MIVPFLYPPFPVQILLPHVVAVPRMVGPRALVSAASVAAGGGDTDAGALRMARSSAAVALRPTDAPPGARAPRTGGVAVSAASGREGVMDASASGMVQRFAPTGDHFHWNAHDGFGLTVLEPGRFDILDGFQRIEGSRRHGVLRGGMATV